MEDIKKMINECYKAENPIAKNITEEEFPELVNNLRERLNTTQTILDLTPDSLNKLAKLLMSYYKVWNLSGKSITNNEVLKIIREISAYFGQTILSHTDGKLHSVNNSILGTEIIFQRTTKAKKGDIEITSQNAVISLGQIGAGTWSAIVKGIEPKLLRSYQIATAKNVKEFH